MSNGPTTSMSEQLSSQRIPAWARVILSVVVACLSFTMWPAHAWMSGADLVPMVAMLGLFTACRTDSRVWLLRNLESFPIFYSVLISFCLMFDRLSAREAFVRVGLIVASIALLPLVRR